MRKHSLRRAVFDQLDPRVGENGFSTTNKALFVVIVVAVAIAVIETEPSILAGRERLFLTLELMFSSLFAVEYLIRLWSIVEDPRYHGAVRGRLRWMVSFEGLVDLAAFLPSLLIGGTQPTYLIRLARVARMLRLAQFGRATQAFKVMAEAIAERKHEFTITAAAGALMLLFAATGLYIAESHVQPEKFGSIPRSLWWAVITLTTIGYGDTYPVTVMGKFLASVTAVIGVGLVAAPTGILAAAFSHAFQRHRRKKAAADRHPEHADAPE